MLKIAFDQGKFEKMVKAIHGAPNEIKEGMRVAMESSLMEVHGKSVQNSPFKTGNLRRSLQWKSEVGTNKIVGAVGTNLIYARMQEFGGTIVAKSAKFLVFKGSRGWASVKKVVVPAKHFLGKAITDSRESIRQRFSRIQAIKKS